MFDYETVKKTIDEIYRILKLGGYFFFTPYSKSHTSYLESSKDGNFVEVKSGSLKGTGFVCFYDEDDIRNLFPDERWKLIELSESVSRDRLSGNINGGWKVVVEKR